MTSYQQNGYELTKDRACRNLYKLDHPHVFYDARLERFADDSDEIHYRLWRPRSPDDVRALIERLEKARKDAEGGS